MIEDYYSEHQRNTNYYNWKNPRSGGFVHEHNNKGGKEIELKFDSNRPNMTERSPTNWYIIYK